MLPLDCLLPLCILVPSLPQTIKVHTPLHMMYKKCALLDQAAFFPCSIVQFWCSGAHCRCSWQWTGSAWTLWPVCGYTASCNELCVLTPFCQSQHQLFQQFVLQKHFCVIEPDRPAFTPHMCQWALATHDPDAASPVVLAWIAFGRYYPLHTLSKPQDLLCWRWHSCLAITILLLSKLLSFLCFAQPWEQTCFLIYSTRFQEPQ